MVLRKGYLSYTCTPLDENTLKYLYEEALSECCISGKTKEQILHNAQKTATVDFLWFNKANRFYHEQSCVRWRYCKFGVCL